MPVLLVTMVLLGLAAGIGVTVVVARFRPPPPRVVVVLVVAALFVGMALRLSAVGQLPALPAYLYFVGVGVALTLIDLDCKRLPNALVLPSYPVVLVLLAVAALGQHDGAAIVRALIGMAVLFGLYLVLALIYPAGMGFGDVKLAGVLGAVLGYLSYAVLLIGGFAGFFLGAVLGLVLIISRRGSRKSTIPFGPYMIGGALVAIFAAEPLARGYLRMITGSS